jgi:hypothetical protein
MRKCAEFAAFTEYFNAGVDVDEECDGDDQPDRTVEDGDAEVVPFERDPAP